ncbi:hypothetical protein, partial [Streptomyces ipomoeae]|uniref:hypothetical protein n=1 Tax=Streptomyces ipomoeae TaxID=103232 RepID=UPI001C66E7D1
MTSTSSVPKPQLEDDLPEAAQAEQESGPRVRVVLVDQGLGLAVDAVLVGVGRDPHVHGESAGGVEPAGALGGGDGGELTCSSG